MSSLRPADPLGSRNKVKDPAATPLVPCKCGRPLGSRNKRTLAALVVAAIAESAGAAPAAVVAAAPAGAVTSAAADATAPVGAASTASLTVTPLEAAAAIIGAAIAVEAAPPGLAGVGVGGSSSVAAAAVRRRRPRRSLARQRLSYISEHGFTTFVVHLRARCEVRLPLPPSFIGTLGRNPLMSVMVEEGSGGQPLYLIEILHDEQGKTTSPMAGRGSSMTTT
jgi:hypothetical protein